MNTRQKIVEQAISSFNERGYGHVSLQDLAKEMGISRGNLSYHFPDKSDLLPEIVKQLVQRLQAYRLKKNRLPTFSNMRMDLKFYFSLQEDFRCIFLDPSLLAHDSVKSTIQEFSREAILDFDAAIAFALEMGTMKPEPFPGIYHNLSINTWMLLFLWYPRELVLGKRSFEEKEKATWCMLIPYFTQKGLNALKNVLGEAYLNELGPSVEGNSSRQSII